MGTPHMTKKTWRAKGPKLPKSQAEAEGTPGLEQDDDAMPEGEADSAGSASREHRPPHEIQG